MALRKLNIKGAISMIACILAIPMAYVNPVISGVLFFTQSMIWLIPDKNVEKALLSEHLN